MNKNGWGLRVELAFLLLFLVCILISVIGLHKLGLLGDGEYKDNNNYINNTINYDYDSLERKVVNAASEYYKDNYNSQTDDTLVVTTSKLIDGNYMNKIYDDRNRECKGYALIMKNNNIVSYIKCSVYKTTGYSESYE